MTGDDGAQKSGGAVANVDRSKTIRTMAGTALRAVDSSVSTRDERTPPPVNGWGARGKAEKISAGTICVVVVILLLIAAMIFSPEEIGSIFLLFFLWQWFFPPRNPR